MFKPSEGQLELSCLQHALQINWLAGGRKRVEGKSRVKTINPGEVKIVKTCEAYRCYMLYGSHLISTDLNVEEFLPHETHEGGSSNTQLNGSPPFCGGGG